ncbi:type 1 glutamine amidotransferase [Sphaerisporangium rubeum]|uniref:GMP synthase-like glutamine amidotransferase n=1 Tax=Sphaerisporangium rubeum TaxID=321317 RepID=A0A7X0IIM0_9ACTN|nr:type 1 glutamine amidotransferase [Sphaerisporangium rubeum]MBB6474703.1 GMP synthase-like glutamine amidotransferase [Sphaerisporangium rubeum]
MHHRVLVVEHEADAGLGFFEGWLAAAGVTCDVVRPYLGEDVPAAPGDGLIVLGGAASAWDDAGYPWQPATRALLRTAVETSVPVLGICLGAQLLTMACGGVVERGTPGLEVGLRTVTMLPAATRDPLFGVLPPAPRAVQYHSDAMTVLPPGAVPMVTGAPYPAQGYRLGDLAWAVQFHPEATPAIFTSWLADPAPLTAAGYDPAALDAAVRAAAEELAATWRPFAEAFAAVVTRARPRSQPLAPLSIPCDHAITARNH